MNINKITMTVLISVVYFSENNLQTSGGLRILQLKFPNYLDL